MELPVDTCQVEAHDAHVTTTNAPIHTCELDTNVLVDVGHGIARLTATHITWPTGQRDMHAGCVHHPDAIGGPRMTVRINGNYRHSFKIVDA